jgi:hypothetical protein
MADFDAPPPPPSPVQQFKFDPRSNVISGPGGTARFDPKTNRIVDPGGADIGRFDPRTGRVTTTTGFTGTFDPSTLTITGRMAAPVPVPLGGGGFGFDFGALLEGLELGLSAEEKALIQEQILGLRQQRDMLLEQMRMQDLFGEFQVEQSGFDYVRAPSDPAARRALAKELGLDVKDLPAAGKVATIRAGPTALSRQTLERELLDHSLKALRGELPVSPTLARSFQDRDQLLGEALRRQLGPGYETSSPGIEALSEERQFQTEALEAARRGELTMAEQFGLGRAGQRLADTASVASVPAAMLPGIAGFGANAAGFSGPIGALGASRQAANQGFLAAAGLAANVMLGQRGLALQAGDLALRNRALDLQNMLGQANLGLQRDAVSAQRDAALWNAIATGAGLVGGALLA